MSCTLRNEHHQAAARGQHRLERRRRGDGEEGPRILIARMISRIWGKDKQIEQRCRSCLLLFILVRCWRLQQARLDCDWPQPSIDSFERQIQAEWTSAYVRLHAGRVQSDVCRQCLTGCDDAIVWRMRANWALDLGFFTTLFVSLWGSKSFCCVCDGSLDYFMIEMIREALVMRWWDHACYIRSEGLLVLFNDTFSVNLKFQGLSWEF